jgi:hypothetical protein
VPRLTPVIPATREAEIGRIKVQGQPSSGDPISKMTRVAWMGGAAQAIEHKALSSNPSPTKNKHEKGKRQV